MVSRGQRLRLLGVIVTLVLAVASTAESSEKAAIKQFKTAAKTRLGAFQATLTGTRVTVLARIGAFDVAVATNGFANPRRSKSGR